MSSVPLRRNREFRLLWSGQAISQLGSQISLVAYPLLALAVTGSPAKAGLVGFALNVPIAVLALPAGMLADRVNRRHLMVAADGVRGVALGSIGYAAATGQVAVRADRPGRCVLLCGLRPESSGRTVQIAVGARGQSSRRSVPPRGGERGLSTCAARPDGAAT